MKLSQRDNTSMILEDELEICSFTVRCLVVLRNNQLLRNVLFYRHLPLRQSYSVVTELSRFYDLSVKRSESVTRYQKTLKNSYR